MPSSTPSPPEDPGKPRVQNVNDPHMPLTNNIFRQQFPNQKGLLNIATRLFTNLEFTIWLCFHQVLLSTMTWWLLDSQLLRAMLKNPSSLLCVRLGVSCALAKVLKLSIPSQVLMSSETDRALDWVLKLVWEALWHRESLDLLVETWLQAWEHSNLVGPLTVFPTDHFSILFLFFCP